MERTHNKVIDNEKLIREWDYKRNSPDGANPEQIALNSHKKVWWKCEKGHSWQAMVANRYRHGRGCPYCAHQLPIKGETDLKTCYPDLAKEWHPTKNELAPDEVMPGTHKRAWWICELGHEWSAEIKSRTTGVGCPYCAGKKVLSGFNDLATINPQLAKEWHPTKNERLKPSDVTFSSGKKVWWICQNKHEFLSSIDSRNRGQGCPQCQKAFKTSFPEQAIFYYVKKEFPDAINSYRGLSERSMELDIYIPSIKVGIEYDGKLYHSKDANRLRDAKKYELCKSEGICLIRIEEIKRHVPFITCDRKIEIPDASDKHLNIAINSLCYYLGRIVVPDVRRDRNEILEQLGKRRVSLATEFHEISAEWDYEKNMPLVPENFAPHANERVFWICSKCGNSWKAAIGDRTGDDKNGCPNCAAKRGSEKRIQTIINVRGSLASNQPQLLEEWDYKSNKDLLPEEITSGSGKKVWWICKTCGHKWSAAVYHRTHGRGCPYCAGKKKGI